MKLLQSIRSRIHRWGYRKLYAFYDGLLEDFPLEKQPAVPESLAAYPMPHHMADEQTGFFLSAAFLITPQAVEAVEKLISRSFPEVLSPWPHQNLAGECRRLGNARGERLRCHVWQDYGGTCYSLSTNGTDFLIALGALHLEPPPPWVSFPGEDPATLIVSRLDREYWWPVLWKPFWEHLTEEEQKAYLRRHGGTPEWEECLWQTHYEIPRTLKEWADETPEGAGIVSHIFYGSRM